MAAASSRHRRGGSRGHWSATCRWSLAAALVWCVVASTRCYGVAAAAGVATSTQTSAHARSIRVSLSSPSTGVVDKVRVSLLPWRTALAGGSDVCSGGGDGQQCQEVDMAFAPAQGGDSQLRALLARVAGALNVALNDSVACLVDAAGYRIVDVDALDHQEEVAAVLASQIVDGSATAQCAAGGGSRDTDVWIARASASLWRRDAIAGCAAPALVRDMYEAEPYPPVYPALERPNALQALTAATPLRISHFLFDGGFEWRGATFRAMAAGGGTGSSTVALAVFLQRMGVAEAHIVHLDLSAKSIAVARRRYHAHKDAGTLPSVTVHFVRGSITDARRLLIGDPQIDNAVGVSTHGFDFITVFGVLHHMLDPLAGLRELSSLLRADGRGGGIQMFVYAGSGRTGIYDFQNAMRELERLTPVDALPSIGGDGGETSNRTPLIARARAVLSAVPETNWLRRNDRMLGTGEMTGQMGDSGVSDMLLHECDVPLSFDEVVRLADRAGLAVRDSNRRAAYSLRDLLDALRSDQAPSSPEMPPQEPDSGIRSTFMSVEERHALADDIEHMIESRPWTDTAALAELLRGDVSHHHVWMVRRDFEQLLSKRAAARSTSDGGGDGDAVHYVDGVEVSASSVLCAEWQQAYSLTPAQFAVFEEGLHNPRKTWDIKLDTLSLGNAPALSGVMLNLTDCKRSVRDMHAHIMEHTPPTYALSMDALVAQMAAFYRAVADTGSFVVLRVPLDDAQLRDIKWEPSDDPHHHGITFLPQEDIRGKA